MSSRDTLIQRLRAAENLKDFLFIITETQAVVAAGTEAVALQISTTLLGEKVAVPIVHIRPDGSGQQRRSQALEAFQQLAKPCIEQGKDGAIEINAPTAGSHTEKLFCLVTLLRKNEDIRAVSCVINRCQDLAQAKQKLIPAQLIAGYFDLLAPER